MARKVKGLRPDTQDDRDIKYHTRVANRTLKAMRRLVPFKALVYPPYVNLTETAVWPEVFDQGPIGSCVEQAWVGPIAFLLNKEDNVQNVMSRLFIYYNVRGGVPEDTGSSIRDGIKSVATDGACVEELWPYDVANWKLRPPDEAYAEGRHRIEGLEYQRLRNGSIDDMVHCLSEGYPFVFGMLLFDQFDTLSAWDYKVALPRPGEVSNGGHAVCAVGYDLAMKCFIVRNSWGPNWGRSGYFYLPFDYAKDPNLVWDLWTVRKIAQ